MISQEMDQLLSSLLDFHHSGWKDGFILNGVNLLQSTQYTHTLRSLAAQPFSHSHVQEALATQRLRYFMPETC